MKMQRVFLTFLTLSCLALSTQVRADGPDEQASIRAINKEQHGQPGLQWQSADLILLPPGQKLVSFSQAQMRDVGMLGGDSNRAYNQYVLRAMRAGEQAETYTFYLEENISRTGEAGRIARSIKIREQPLKR